MEKIEPTEFAKRIGAWNMRSILGAKLHRRNYFVLPQDTYLIVKVTTLPKPFFGLGRKFVDAFNTCTTAKGTWFFVGLDSNSSGWVLSKSQLNHGIANGSFPCSNEADPQQRQYKIHEQDFRHEDRFLSIDEFRQRIVQPR